MTSNSCDDRTRKCLSCDSIEMRFRFELALNQQSMNLMMLPNWRHTIEHDARALMSLPLDCVCDEMTIPNLHFNRIEFYLYRIIARNKLKRKQWSRILWDSPNNILNKKPPHSTAQYIDESPIYRQKRPTTSVKFMFKSFNLNLFAVKLSLCAVAE